MEIQNQAAPSIFLDTFSPAIKTYNLQQLRLHQRQRPAGDFATFAKQEIRRQLL